jgi:hypothetical protein
MGTRDRQRQADNATPIDAPPSAQTSQPPGQPKGIQGIGETITQKSVSPKPGS